MAFTEKYYRGIRGIRGVDGEELTELQKQLRIEILYFGKVY